MQSNQNQSKPLSLSAQGFKSGLSVQELKAITQLRLDAASRLEEKQIALPSKSGVRSYQTANPAQLAVAGMRINMQQSNNIATPTSNIVSPSGGSYRNPNPRNLPPINDYGMSPQQQHLESNFAYDRQSNDKVVNGTYGGFSSQKFGGSNSRNAPGYGRGDNSSGYLPQQFQPQPPQQQQPQQSYRNQYNNTNRVLNQQGYRNDEFIQQPQQQQQQQQQQRYSSQLSDSFNSLSINDEFFHANAQIYKNNNPTSSNNNYGDQEFNSALPVLSPIGAKNSSSYSSGILSPNSKFKNAGASVTNNSLLNSNLPGYLSPSTKSNILNDPYSNITEFMDNQRSNKFGNNYDSLEEKSNISNFKPIQRDVFAQEVAQSLLGSGLNLGYRGNYDSNSQKHLPVQSTAQQYDFNPAPPGLTRHSSLFESPSATKPSSPSNNKPSILTRHSSFLDTPSLQSAMQSAMNTKPPSPNLKTPRLNDGWLLESKLPEAVFQYRSYHDHEITNDHFETDHDSEVDDIINTNDLIGD